jgi:hypothetical protein
LSHLIDFHIKMRVIEIKDLPKSARGSESSDFVESIRFKDSVLAGSVTCLCIMTVRWKNSYGIRNLDIVFWKFNRRFARPSGPSPAKLNKYNQINFNYR